MKCPDCSSEMEEDALEIDGKDYPCWYCACGNIVRREE